MIEVTCSSEGNPQPVGRKKYFKTTVFTRKLYMQENPQNLYVQAMTPPIFVTSVALLPGT